MPNRPLTHSLAHTLAHSLTAGEVMPNGREGEMYAAGVTIVVHPLIPTKGRNADVVCTEAREVRRVCVGV